MDNTWKQKFLNKNVKLICNDPPRPRPRVKKGLCISVSDNHIVLENNSKTEAILLTLIRRLEILE